MTVSAEVANVQRWRHRIPLPDGVITPGSQDTAAQLKTIGLPEDLSGSSVLDVGCSDGYFSFECERRGAARILAVDNFSSVYIDSPSGFQVAHKLLDSKVEFLQASLFELEPSRIGQFDFVLFLGVLYHLRHPLLALERLGALCKRQLIMETQIAELAPGRLARLFSAITKFQLPQNCMEFYPSNEINLDPTTWWAPTAACAEAMLSSCGFCDVKTNSIFHQRGVFHAFTPQFGDDVAQLVSEYGEQAVAEAYGRFVGRSVKAREIVSLLRSVSITGFGQIKQDLAESRGRNWHQVTRWQAT